MAIYKALDIREVIKPVSGPATICIAKDLETGFRVRFEFKASYSNTCMGKTYYYGYTGDHHLLIPGDTFELEQTDTYMHLTILDVK